MKNITKIFRNIFFLLLFVFVTSCAHIKSGHHIMLTKGDTVQRLAILYAVSESMILNANPGKRFSPGEIVFIPLNRGIASFLNNPYDFSDYTGFSSANIAGKLLWPVPSSPRISSYFGMRGIRHHDGIDIPGRSGSHVLAAMDGKVTYSGNGISGYGNLVIIHHGSGFYTVYGHNKKNFVRKGDKVYKGQVITQLGNTGRSSGPHLHFEVRTGTKPVDPIAYLPVKNSYHVARK